jgi:hypothetical protein
MRIAIVIPVFVLLLVPAAALAQQPALDLNKVWTPADSVDGRPVLDSLPQLINCPRYDPKDVRGDESTFSFESRPELERLPAAMEAEIEILVRKDGKIDSRRTKVVRSTDYRLDRSLEYWVQRCVFRPGMIGGEAVEVRMVRTFEIQIPR